MTLRKGKDKEMERGSNRSHHVGNWKRRWTSRKAYCGVNNEYTTKRNDKYSENYMMNIAQNE
jgi:hypothetical protein